MSDFRIYRVVADVVMEQVADGIDSFTPAVHRDELVEQYGGEENYAEANLLHYSETHQGQFVLVELADHVRGDRTIATASGGIGQRPPQLRQSPLMALVLTDEDEAGRPS